MNATASHDVALSDQEIQLLEKLIQQLQSSPKDPKPQADQLAVVIKIATEWEPASRLPGLDILRLCAVAPAFAQHTSSAGVNIIDTLAKTDVFSASGDRPNNTMLAVRVLGNLFASEEGRSIVDAAFESVNSYVDHFTSSSANKGLAAAIATLYINYAVLLVSGVPSLGSSTREQRAQAVISGAVRLLKPERDSETVYRALVAVGTLLSLGHDFGRSVAHKQHIPDVLKTLENSAVGKENRISAVIREVRDQLR